MKTLFQNTNTSTDDIVFSKTSKNMNIKINIAKKKLLYRPTKLSPQQTTAKLSSIFLATKLVKHFSFLYPNESYNFSKIFNEKKKKDGVNKFLLLSPRLISLCIQDILNKNANKTSIFTSANLNIGITASLARLIEPFKQNILGVKIQCSGK